MSETTRRLLGQYFTPRWAAEAIVDRHFSKLSHGDIVIEPSCGAGAFLHALPREVTAIGVEIDPRWAETARRETGRTVLLGDFLDVPLPAGVSAVIGNPPFHADTIARFLDRAHDLLQEGGKCGLILPAYVLQTSTKVLSMAEKWSISQELMPRNIFPRLSVPICFSMFTKERSRRLFGFFLYQEAAEVGNARPEVRETLERSPRAGSVWRQAVHEAFDAIERDEVPLEALYAAVERRRPTANRFPREKIRQTLGAFNEFVNVDRGIWARHADRVARTA